MRRRTGGQSLGDRRHPLRDTAALLRACVDSVLATAGDCELELVLVDNGSEEPETLTLVERLAARDG